MSNRDTDPASYRSNDIELLREVVESGEARLQAQLTASLAADQRALVLAGFLAAAAVALIGGSIALLIAAPPQSDLGGWGLFAALVLILSLSIVVYSARPVNWGYPGTKPQAWIADISTSKPDAVRLAERLADIESQAEENATIMDANGRCIRTALFIAAAGLVLCGGGAVLHLVSVGAFG